MCCDFGFLIKLKSLECSLRKADVKNLEEREVLHISGGHYWRRAERISSDRDAGYAPGQPSPELPKRSCGWLRST